MTRPRTSSAYLNRTSIIVLGLWSVIVIGLPGIRPALAGAEAPRTILSQPDSHVGLTIDLAGFTIDRDQAKPDGRRYVMASHPTTGLNVSVTLETVSGRASTTGCVARLQQLQKGPFVSRGKDIALTTRQDVQTLEYTLEQFQGVRLDQKSMYACMAEQNVYANIHLSKVQYTAADASLFHALLKTIRLQPSQSQKAATPTPAMSTSLQQHHIENVRLRHASVGNLISPPSSFTWVP